MTTDTQRCGQCARRAPEPCERHFTQEVAELAAIKGWLVHAAEPAHKRGRIPLAGDAGWPDLTLARIPLLAEGRGELLLIELKVGKAKLSLDQKRWHEVLAKLGCQVFTFYPHDWEKIEAVLEWD